MLGLPVRNLMCCCYLFGEYLCTQTSNIDGDVLLASPEKARRAESCTSLWNKLWKSVKELFWSVPPGVFSRLASAKVRTFIITKKPFPYFSYKKVDFYQKTAGYTIYNIYKQEPGKTLVLCGNDVWGFATPSVGEVTESVLGFTAHAATRWRSWQAANYAFLRKIYINISFQLLSSNSKIMHTFVLGLLAFRSICRS